MRMSFSRRIVGILRLQIKVNAKIQSASSSTRPGISTAIHRVKSGSGVSQGGDVSPRTAMATVPATVQVIESPAKVQPATFCSLARDSPPRKSELEIRVMPTHPTYNSSLAYHTLSKSVRVAVVSLLRELSPKP